MLVVGIDVGSVSAEAVVLKDGEVVGRSALPTGASARRAGERALQAALERSGVTGEDLDYIVATGYGRASLEFANRQVTEISCHARGAHHLFPDVRTVIDIGGQDSKAIRVDENGAVIDFAMNEKCAAGTGRFLEVMARALELKVEDLQELSLHARRAASINSICTVFAESEVVSLIAEDVPVDEIVAGLHASIAERVSSLVRRVGLEPRVVMTGGVARNRGVVRALEEHLGCSVTVPEDPQIVGALGAALLAEDFACRSIG